jgi:antitoxin HicB
MLAYPARLHRQGPDFLVEFPDFPNIATYGKDQNEALLHAEEALNGCIESDFARGFNIPPPSAAKGRGVHLIPVRPHVAVAVLLRQMRGSLTQQEIAARLNISFQVYQRLENPRKANPTIKTLEKVAQAYGRRVELGFV